MEQLFSDYESLVGFAALVAVIINALKQFGIAKDGDAPKWSLGLNLFGLVGLYVIGLTQGDPVAIDGFVGWLAEAGSLTLELIAMLGVSKGANFAVAGAPLVGYRHS